MTTWDEAEEAMLDDGEAAAPVEEEDPFRQTEPEPPVPAPAPAPVRMPSLVVVEHFDFTMVDMNASGANLRVRQISRGEALSLMSKYNAEVLALNVRGQLSLERELGMDDSRVPRIGPGRSLLVMTYIRFSDVRWHLVEYESDGDGVID